MSNRFIAFFILKKMPFYLQNDSLYTIIVVSFLILIKS